MTALCSALRDDLNGRTWPVRAPARRGYFPRLLLADVWEPQILICPGGSSSAREARGYGLETLNVHVSLLKLLAPGQSDGMEGWEEISELDALLVAMEALADHLGPHSGTTLELETPEGVFRATGTTNDPAYNEDHLQNHQQFTSVITVTFEAVTR